MSLENHLLSILIVFAFKNTMKMLPITTFTKKHRNFLPDGRHLIIGFYRNYATGILVALVAFNIFPPAIKKI